MPTRTKPPSLRPQEPREATPKTEYHVGLDIGKRQDFTALAVVEKTVFPDREEPQNLIQNLGYIARELKAYRRHPDPLLRVVYLSRLELNTDYRDQMKIIARQYHKIPRDPGGGVRVEKVAVDVTGVGDGITPLLDDSGVPHRDVWITSGSGESYDRSTRTHHVGRSYLINKAKLAMEQRRLKAGRRLGPLFDVFIKELRGMEYEITPAQNLRYVHREGEHDDLVLAVSLACWSADRWRPLRVMAKPVGF